MKTHASFLDDLKASPRFINRMQKQIFLKRKMAQEASEELHQKTHFKGGASLLMNQDNEAKLTLHLKNTSDGPTH